MTYFIIGYIAGFIACFVMFAFCAAAREGDRD